MFGGQNENLSFLEQALGLEIISRGNEITLIGDIEKIALGREILNLMWSKLKRGEDVDIHTVSAALRFSDEHAEEQRSAPQHHHQRRKTDHHKDGKPMTSSTPTNLKELIETKGQIVTRKKTIAPRGPVQAAYIEAMQKHEAVFGIGPAGTGKTYLAVAQAVSLFEQEKVERIILSRPAVEAGERLGFLPGDLKEKIDPYLRPLYDALYDTMGAEKAEKRILSKDIEIAPLAFMRGRTLNRAFVILDEAQNTTAMQMKMFLTRLGEGSRMVITGDPTQIDLPSGETSGLLQAMDILHDLPEVGLIRFGSKDVVRSDLVAKIVTAYDRHDGRGGAR